MSASSPTNPYESPRESKGDPARFGDTDSAEMADLRRRVQELERRVGRSWVVHPNFLLRIFAVWGYWLLGYLVIAAVTAALMFLFRALAKL